MPKKKPLVVTWVGMPADMRDKLSEIMEAENRRSLSNTIVSVLARWLQAQKPAPN